MKKSLIVVFSGALVILLSLFCVYIFYIRNGVIKTDMDKVDMWSQLITIFLSIITLCMQSLMTYFIFEFDRKSQNTNIAIALKDFTGIEMTECRHIVGGLRDSLRAETKEGKTEIRDKLKQCFINELKDAVVSANAEANADSMQIYNGYSQSIKLIRYFEGLYHYILSEETARMCFLYYAWWRNYLMNFIMIYDEALCEFEQQLKDGEIYVYKDYPLLKTRHVWATKDCKKMDLIKLFDKRLKRYNYKINYYSVGERTETKRDWGF